MISDREIAKIMDLRDLPVVEVTWLDATSYHGWDTLAGSRKDTPEECKTVGRLIRKDRKFVSVAQTVNAGGKVSENWVIPRPWVLSILVLKTARRQKKRNRR